MRERKRSHLSLLVILAGALILALAATPTVAYADEHFPVPNQGTCINCHEDLYFLHDTGKWFCLKEAPMACVDCHGGDRTATTQEKAHAHRNAYPVVNKDIAKCRECHPAKSVERVQIFKQVAGISPVMVAVAYIPAVTESAVVPVLSQEQSPTSLLWQDGILLVVLAGLMLAIVFMAQFNLRKGSQH